MGTMASQIISLTIVYYAVYSDADQRKHQSCVSLAFVRGIHRGPVNSPHKWPVTRKMFPFDDVIMIAAISQTTFQCIFLNESVLISLRISLKFVPVVWINNNPALVQLMTMCRPGDRPLSEPMMVSLLTHICINRPQWVNTVRPQQNGSALVWPMVIHMQFVFIFMKWILGQRTASFRLGPKQMATIPQTPFSNESSWQKKFSFSYCIDICCQKFNIQ